MFFLKVRRKRKKSQGIDEKQLAESMQRELDGYVKRDELREYLAKIERDERKKKLWGALSSRKKIKVLKYALERKGGSHGKK